MEDKESKIRNLILLVMFIITFVLGVSGFYMAGYTLNNAVFTTFTLYVLNFTDFPQNVLINLARYIAAVFTVSTILVLLKGFVLQIILWVKAKFTQSTVILGNNNFVEEFAKSIGCRGIRCNGEFIKAKRYVLLDNEALNLMYYEKHKEYLANKPVFIRSDSFSNVIVKNGNHRFFSIEELTARKYWRENSLIDLAFVGEDIKPVMSIVIIGFSKLGEELLYQSLLTNIFYVDQTIKYHIFGDVTKFGKIHKNLDQLNVVLHEDNWYDDPKLLETADKIIVDVKDANFTVINELLELIRKGNIDVLTDTAISDEIILDHRTGRAFLNLNVIYWPKVIYNENCIINEEGVIKAQKLNKKYVDVYSSDKGKTQEQLWSELDTFDRYSNIAAVDYHYIREKLLKKWGCAIAEFEDHIDELASLEHKRWCIYHLYNNWDYCESPIKNNPSKTKNKKLRLHKDLIPYEKLPEVEKEKDKTQIRYLFEVFGDN